MHEHKLPTLHDMLVQLDDAYNDYLVVNHPEAFNDDIETFEDAHTSILTTTLKPKFEKTYNQIAQVLGYKNLNEYITETLEDEGVSQSEWVKQWQEERLAAL